MGSDIEHQRIHDEVRVIAEFGDVSDGTSYVEHGMAREIMRLRSILAALREPSEKVLLAAVEAVSYGASYAALMRCIPAAVAAAEREASDDPR